MTKRYYTSQYSPYQIFTIFNHIIYEFMTMKYYSLVIIFSMIYANYCAICANPYNKHSCNMRFF